MKLEGIDANGAVHEYETNNFRSPITVLYFYPKDNTSGCTAEACDFRDNLNRIAAKAKLIGVSPDSITSHQNFQKKHNLNFTLLSDPEHFLAEKFGVWKQKSMYGRQYMGIERSTFIIDGKGNILKEWRKVKVSGHVDEVLQFLQNMQ